MKTLNIKFKIFYKYLLIISLIMFVISCGNSKTENYTQKQKDSLELLNNSNNIATEKSTTSDEGSSSVWTILLVLIITIAIAAGIFYFFYAFIPLRLWYEARLSKVKVEWVTLLKMYFQKVPQEKILRILIKAQNARISIDAKDLSNHYLAHVDIDVITNTLIRAQNANLKLELNELAAQYLARVDVEKVLHSLIMAKNAGVDTDIKELASFYLANVDVEKIITAKIRAKNSGYTIPLVELKEHYLSGGHVDATVEAFVAAKKANLLDFDFSDICEIDLANYDVVQAVKSAITPKIIETSGVRGVARDGVEMTLKVKITLRSFIKTIIGGVSAETVLARVNEGLATEIGMSVSHYDILQSPFELAERVEQRGLSDKSSYEILSIDVSDISVGKDIHAELKIERALANAEQAKAELIMAEEKVQKAMAAAFLDGKLSVHQYHEMKNTEADTEMRRKLGNSVVKEVKKEGHHGHDSHNKEDEHKKDDHH